MHESPLLLLSVIGLLGIACQWVAWRVGVPAIVFLLITGMIAGPVTGVLRPDELFGDLLFPMVSIGVAVILFEGSLTLRIHQIRNVEGAVRNMITVGAAVTWGIVAVATHFLMGLSWGLSLLFGAVMTVTGPTVIKPLLHSAQLNANVSRVLQWEGIVLDPIGALLTVLVFDFLVTGQTMDNPWVGLARIVVIGVLFGLAGARLLAMLMIRHWLPHYLHHVFTLVLVIAVFAISDAIAHEAGLLAVTLMGIILANEENFDVEDLLFFKESLSVLLISVLFIVLAARMDPGALIDLGLPGLALFLVVILVARPLSVLAATWNSSLNRGEKIMLGWIAPRGIVAAAVSALFALRLGEAGYEGAEVLVPLTFGMIIGTVGLQSITAKPLARRLGVTAPEPSGYLIVGANPVARTIAASLKAQGFAVRLADTGWENVRTARMEGLETYFGGAVSEHAERNLDLTGIGRLLALSPHPTLNALACMSYKYEFGPSNLYRIPASVDKKDSMRRSLPGSVPGRMLFGKEVTHSKLASMIAKGARIRTTRLSDDFGFEDYVARYKKRAIPLYAISPNGKLHMFTTSDPPRVQAGWQVAGLIPARVLAEMAEEKAESKAENASGGAGSDPEPA